MNPAELYVVRVKCGRDRKRLYLTAGAADAPYPAVWIVNGALHPVDKPKMKNIAHLTWIAPLSADEKTAIAMDYSDKTVAEILAKYEQNGENAKILAKGENLA